MKNKFVSLLCATTLAITAMLVGCGDNNASDSGAQDDTAAVLSTEASEEASSEESADAASTGESVGEEVEINVAALKGPTSMGMVNLMEQAKNGSTGANQYTFTIAAAPDEVTPGIVQGKIDVAAVPANLAAVLSKKTEGGVKVAAINTLGVLYIVENGETVKTVEDLKGKTIYASGKGSTPEYALNYMLKANGIDPDKDVTIEYKAEHAECVSALNSNSDGVAMLPQPFVTTAMISNEKTRIAIDMTKEWEKAAEASGSSATLVTGVVVVRTEFAEKHPEAVKLFLDQYEESVKFTNENIEEASKLIESNGIIKAAVAAKAIPFCNITYIEGDEMKEKLSGYLNELFAQNPESVGGAVPDDEFYFIEK